MDAVQEQPRDPIEKFRECLRYRKVSVNLLHKDPYNAIGGIEKYAKEIAAYLLEVEEISSVMLFPRTLFGVMYYGVAVDGELVATLSARSVVYLFERLLQSGEIEIEAATLHQIGNWQREDLDGVLGVLFATDALRNVWLHDYALLCRHPNLLYNSGVFCGPPDTHHSEKCRSCTYGQGLSEYRAYSRTLLARVHSVIAPSPAAREVFLTVYPEFRRKCIVSPYYRLNQVAGIHPPQVTDEGRKVAIAFLGAPIQTKGIAPFTTLVNRFGEKFDWATIGVVDYFEKNPNVRHLHYNFHVNREPRALIRELAPAYVFLGSIWPETFAFTLAETLTAGAPVLTFEQSGNVADTVRRLNAGKVFSGVEQMADYLSGDPRQIREEILNCRIGYESGLNIEGTRSLYMRSESARRMFLPPYPEQQAVRAI